MAASLRAQRLRRRGLRSGAAALAVALVAVAAGCRPAEPATGRAGRVRVVLVLGDSVTYGLFGTTPRLHERLARRLADQHVRLVVDGFPGETPIDTWPGNPSWADRLRGDIERENPDMVVIQSMLFPSATDPARQDAYRAAIRGLYDIAQSRGAHVYVVSHPEPPVASERDELRVAQRLQAEEASGRGISTIPLDWWLNRCKGAYVTDGWHLSAKGQECHASAVAVAVAQLRAAVG